MGSPDALAHTPSSVAKEAAGPSAGANALDAPAAAQAAATTDPASLNRDAPATLPTSHPLPERLNTDPKGQTNVFQPGKSTQVAPRAATRDLEHDDRDGARTGVLPARSQTRADSGTDPSAPAVSSDHREADGNASQGGQAAESVRPGAEPGAEGTGHQAGNAQAAVFERADAALPAHDGQDHTEADGATRGAEPTGTPIAGDAQVRIADAPDPLAQHQPDNRDHVVDEEVGVQALPVAEPQAKVAPPPPPVATTPVYPTPQRDYTATTDDGQQVAAAQPDAIASIAQAAIATTPDAVGRVEENEQVTIKEEKVRLPIHAF